MNAQLKYFSEKISAAVLKYPYSYLLLGVIVIVCFWSVSKFDITQLDDTVFINDKHDFIKDMRNLPKTFFQGCFNEKDIYYRPLLVIYFMLLYPFTSPESIMIYHVASIAVHLMNTFLIYHFLKKILTPEKGFVLALIFSVHPVLTMAVAWIPGINDLLLGTFALAYFITLINVFEKGRKIDILLNFIFLLSGLLTKETAAFLPFSGLLIMIQRKYPIKFSNTVAAFIITNAVALGIWFFARRNVLPADAPPLIDGEIVALTMERSVALIQYFGKCLLPFNLNVYPTLHDTSIWYGIASVVLITIGLLLNKTRSPRNIITGMAWFVLFLIPVFLVPAKINNQLYEHRLYLPLIGFLILLSETVLFSTKLPLMIRQTFLLVSISGSIFLIQNYLPAFKDIFSFWKYAVAHSPNDACTNKMFGMKLLAVNRKEEGLRLMFKARGINENEPYTGLFLSQYYYEPKGKLDTARMLLESEIEHNPNIWATYFDLARVCFSVNDLDCAEKNLKTYLEYNPTDQQANFNLTLLLYDRKKYTEAMEQTKQAEKHGVVIEEDLLNLIRKELK